MMYSIHHSDTFPIFQFQNARRADNRAPTRNLAMNALLGGPGATMDCLREKNVEARAARGVLLQANRAAMVVHDFRYDGKSKAHSIFLRREKWIEDLLA